MDREKIYKTMTSGGVWSLVLGITTITAGIAAGVMMVISGARLLAGRNEVVL